MTKLTPLLISAFCLVSGCAPFPDAPLGGPLSLLNTWGVRGSNVPEFRFHDVALDSRGRLFATDPTNSRIMVFDTPGQVEGFAWTIEGMTAPEDIAFDPSGNIYVTSSQGREIQVFSSNQVLIRRWGARAGDPGLKRPVDLAVGGNGIAYILENDPEPVIKMYAADGTFIKRIFSTGDSDQYVMPTCVAVDGIGYLYAGYQENLAVGSVRRFSSEGLLLDKWLLPNTLALTPIAITISPTDRVHISDSRGTITRLNNDGSIAFQWGKDPAGVQYMIRPEGIAVSPDGTTYVADAVFNGLYRFSSSGTLVDVREPVLQESKVVFVKGLAVDPSGFVYVIDQQSSRLQIFNEDGEFIKTWGRPGRRTGYLYLPQDVAVDGAGLIYVADRDNSRIQVFDETGRVVRSWRDSGVTSLAVTDAAVFSMSSREIRKYTPQGVSLGRLTAVGEKSFVYLEALALDSQGMLYAADGGEGKVHVFSDSLDLIRSMNFLSRRDAFDNIDIAVDSQFRVYVADYQGYLVQILNPDGSLLRNWNPLEPGHGPTAIAIDARNDHIYLARVSGPVYEFSDLGGDASP